MVFACAFALGALAQSDNAGPGAEGKRVGKAKVEERGASKLKSPEPGGPSKGWFRKRGDRNRAVAKLNLKQGELFSSLDNPDTHPDQEILPAGSLVLDNAEPSQVFQLYQTLSGRTVLASPLPPDRPPVRMSLKNEKALTRQQALQMLDTILAQHGIIMIVQGSSVKAVQQNQALGEAVTPTDLAPDQLPESSSYCMYVIEVKNRRPGELAKGLQPFAKMPNSIVAIDSGKVLILRDYSANVRAMLQVLRRLDRDPER